VRARVKGAKFQTETLPKFRRWPRVCAAPRERSFSSSCRQRQQDVGIPSAIETERFVEDQIACADVEPRRVNPEQSPR
jgi:hypothetical protein